MKHLSYRTKLLLSFTLLFAVFTALLVLFQYNRERQYKRDVLDTRLQSYADVVASTLQDSEVDSVSFDKLTHILPTDLRITVIDRQGNVRFESTDHAVSSMGNHLDRPEVKSATSNGSGSDIRFSETEGREYFYFAKHYGSFIVRMALPYDATVQDFMKADNVFLWFVLMLFPVVLVLLIYTSDRFGKAITGLRDFMASADKGLVDYDRLKFPHSELGDIGRDITQKYKQLEDSNRQIALERERLMRHFHYFDEGIAIFTPERTSIYANPRFMQYVNVLLDHPTPNINAIWDAPLFAPALEFLKINKGGRPITEEAPVFRFNAQAGSNTFAVQLLIYSDGSYEVALSDVTKAEKNRRLKQQMSNNITHELRTPVASIRGYIETIQECPTLPDERKMYFLGKVHAQVLRLTDLIRDVALITKTEEAANLMPREDVKLPQLLEDVEEELHEKFVETQMKLFTDVPADLVIHGNYALLFAIFRNLMENSLRYAGEGKEIHVNCYNATKEFAYFCVYDTGNGVPEEHLPRLFERFYRVSDGRTRGDGGTGLGLSIVRNAVSFHQGDISVRNRKEGGLEFLFSIHL